MDYPTAGRTPAEGLSYPYPMVTDSFPYQPSDELDYVSYVNPDKTDMHSEKLIYDLTPLRSALFFCAMNNPVEPGFYGDNLVAEIRDVDGNVTNRATCGVGAIYSVVQDGDGNVTSASANATCEDVIYEKISTKPVTDCVSQRIIQTDYARLLFTEFIRMYPAAIEGSGVSVPACIGRVVVIS